MDKLSELQRCEIIIQYYNDHPQESKYDIAHYFKELKISELTVYNVLKNYDEIKSAERAQGSGKTPEKMPPKKVEKLLREMKKKVYHYKRLQWSMK